MEIDLSDIRSAFHKMHAVKHSRHNVQDRIRPSLFQYDYLTLSTLVADVQRLIAEVPCRTGVDQDTTVALDLGCGKSPYRFLLRSRGFVVKTMDIDPDSAADYQGTIEETGLPDQSIDLAICTQVLEHSIDPGQGLREICRILRPGGYLIASAPHIWFYHPHPSDNWRFTQEGLPRLVAACGLEPIRLLAQGGSVLSYFQIVNFLLFGLVGKLAAPVYAVTNVIGKLGDNLLTNSLFCHNFAVLARKAEISTGHWRGAEFSA
jgi:SAM-dependent methyltransferase